MVDCSKVESHIGLGRGEALMLSLSATSFVLKGAVIGSPDCRGQAGSAFEFTTKGIAGWHLLCKMEAHNILSLRFLWKAHLLDLIDSGEDKTVKGCPLLPKTC